MHTGDQRSMFFMPCFCVGVQEMDINLDVEYTGKCEMAIDADLVSG